MKVPLRPEGLLLIVMYEEYEQLSLPLDETPPKNTAAAEPGGSASDDSSAPAEAEAALAADASGSEEACSAPETEAGKKQGPVRSDPVPTIKFPSELDPSIELQLKFYKGSGKKQKYRAVLSAPGTSFPYRKKYCDSKKEAMAWVKSEGEEALFEGVDISHFRQVPQKLNLATAFRLMKDTPEAKSFRDYFLENPSLLNGLREQPLATLSVETCAKVLRETFEGEKERAEAVRHLNRLLGLCHGRGLLMRRLQLKYNTRKQDADLRAMHLALNPQVLPEDLCRQLYRVSRKGMKENSYYLAVLLQLTMGLSLSEVAALQFRDLCDGKTDVAADKEWVRPEGEVWYLRIRRFSKRIKASDENGETKCVVMKTENVFKYRLLVIPFQTKEALEEYLESFDSGVLGKTPLISGRKEGGGVTADTLRVFTRSVLKDHGGEQLERRVFLPSRDGIREDAHERLAVRLTVFRSTLEHHMEDCGFGPHEIQSYLGRKPAAVLDTHYWESKTRMAQLRQLRKLARWDLREKPESADEPMHQSWHEACVDADFPVPNGLVGETSLTIRGATGVPVSVSLSVPCGFDCEYEVIHSQKKPDIA